MEGSQQWNAAGGKGTEGLGSCMQASKEDEGNRQGGMATRK